MLPIIIAQLVVLLKDTSLAFVVAYEELLRSGLYNLSNFFGNQYKFSFFFIVLAIYLTMNLTLSWVARRIAKRTGPQAGKLIKPDDEPPVDPYRADPRALGAQSTSQGAGGG